MRFSNKNKIIRPGTLAILALMPPLFLCPRAASAEANSALHEALNQRLTQTQIAYTYDLTQKDDPFLPIKDVRIGDDGDRGSAVTDYISQLRLVAITTAANGSAALASFEDGANRSFIYRTGDTLAKGKWRIKEITASTVTIEEVAQRAGTAPRSTIIKLRTPDLQAGLGLMSRSNQ